MLPASRDVDTPGLARSPLVRDSLPAFRVTSHANAHGGWKWGCVTLLADPSFREEQSLCCPKSG
jgi:hypothetical protein